MNGEKGGAGCGSDAKSNAYEDNADEQSKPRAKGGRPLGSKNRSGGACLAPGG